MSLGGRLAYCDFTLSEGLVLQWKHMTAFRALSFNTPAVEPLKRDSLALSYRLAFWRCVRHYLAYV